MPRHELVVGVLVLSHRAASLASSTPTRIVRAQWQLTDGPLCADIVAKVENRATRKVSRNAMIPPIGYSLDGLRTNRCTRLLRHVGQLAPVRTNIGDLMG